MARAKYKQYYQKMIDEHKELFNDFMDIHDLYQKDRVANQDDFNRIGKKVMDVYYEWERKLCSGMSRSYNQYSYKLADKFKDVIRKDFPLFDMIGVKIKKVKN